MAPIQQRKPSPKMLTTNYNGSSVRVPTLPNVVKDIRTAVGMTQKELAEAAGLSTLTVLRSEQYLYVDLPTPLDTVLAHLENAGRSPVEIATSYSKGRNMQLKVNSDAITSNPYYRSRVRAGINYATDNFLTVDQASLMEDNSNHPFVLFRTYLFAAFDLPTSQIQFCLFTGMNPAVQAKFESYDSNFPDTLKNSLSLILDLTNAELATLEEMVKRAHA